jgi:hypothetical protein
MDVNKYFRLRAVRFFEVFFREEENAVIEKSPANF